MGFWRRSEAKVWTRSGSSGWIPGFPLHLVVKTTNIAFTAVDTIATLPIKGFVTQSHSTLRRWRWKEVFWNTCKIFAVRAEVLRRHFLPHTMCFVNIFDARDSWMLITWTEPWETNLPLIWDVWFIPNLSRMSNWMISEKVAMNGKRPQLADA